MLLQSAAFQAGEGGIDLHIFAAVDLTAHSRRGCTTISFSVRRGHGGWASPSSRRMGQSPIPILKHGNDYIATGKRRRTTEIRSFSTCCGLSYMLLHLGATPVVRAHPITGPLIPPALRFAVIQIREPMLHRNEPVQPAVSKRFHQNFRNSSLLW